VNGSFGRQPGHPRYLRKKTKPGILVKLRQQLDTLSGPVSDWALEARGLLRNSARA